MKKILILGIAIGFTFAVTAQNTQDPTQQAPAKKELKAKLKKELNLTPDQQAQWKSLNKEYKDKMMAVKNNSSLSTEQRRQQFKALATERKNKLNAILTPDQQAKLTAMRTQRVAKFKQHVQALNLTQDQQAQWKSINKEYRDKMMAVRNDKSLSDEQRKEQFKGLVKEKNDKVKSILNADQQTKLAEFRKERRQQMKQKPTTFSSDKTQSNS